MMLHDDFKARIADSETGAELAEHEATCDACAAWARRLRVIVELAPSVVTTTTDDLAPQVLRRMRHRTTRRPMLLAVASAAAALLIGGVVVANRNHSQPDQLATVADDLQASGSFRFVIQASTQVDLHLGTPTDNSFVPLAVQTPVCAGVQPSVSQPVVTAVDPVALVEALLSTDPCQALAHIKAELVPNVVDTYDKIATLATSVSWQIGEAEAMQPTSETERASISAFVARRQTELDHLQKVLNDIVTQLDLAAVTLRAVADAGNQGNHPGEYSAATDNLRALSGIVDSNEAVVVDIEDTTVAWHQVATGTWTPTAATAIGSNEANGMNVAFDDLAGDPLRLANTLLADPDTLLRLLDSAPSIGNSGTVRWIVPDGILGPGQWQSTAVLVAGKLDRLIISSGDTEIMLIPER